MGTRVELPDGNWADLRDPRQLSNGQRKPLTRALATAPREDSEKLTEDGKPVKVVAKSAILELGETAVAVFVESWSLSLPIPADDPTSIDKIAPAYIYDELERECVALIDDAWIDTAKDSDPT